MKPEPKLLLVVWDDAWQDTDNFTSIHGAAQTHKAMIVQTLGWALIDTEVGLKIANERSADDGAEVYRGITFIPRGMIRSATEFKLVSPKKKKAPEVGALRESFDNTP